MLIIPFSVGLRTISERSLVIIGRGISSAFNYSVGFGVAGVIIIYARHSKRKRENSNKAEITLCARVPSVPRLCRLGDRRHG